MIGTKFNLVQGYRAVRRSIWRLKEARLIPGHLPSRRLSREPYHTWRKNGFVRNIIQTGKKRDRKMPETPTVWELMDKYKTPEAGRRLASVMLASGALVGRCLARRGWRRIG